MFFQEKRLMRPSLVAEQAHAGELPEAFRLVFKHVSERERPARVNHALKLVREKELDAAGVWVIRGRSGLLGAMVCMPVPGASALVWPPQAAVADGKQIEDTLLRAALRWVRQRGARLAQTLLAPGEVALAAPIERNGFTHITQLWYLKHDLGLPPELLQPSRELRYLNYTQCDRTLFHQTLLATYEGTEDCPEVNGVRTLDEIIEGHQAQGVHDPRRWWLAFDGAQAAGVLILCELADWQGWDISYLGIVPAQRRRGIGKELTRKAIGDAQAAQASQLTLSVDKRNQPAWQLYRGLGFEIFDRREVYLAIW
jgi:mycothiol synthase